MTYVTIGERRIPAQISGTVRDPKWGYRHTQEIRCGLSYAEAREVFTDGAAWQLVYEEERDGNEQGGTVTTEPVVYDKSDFDQVMSITENRDGTVTVKMGQTTAEEALAILMGGA